MSKKIKKLIKYTRHRLGWRVYERVHGHTLMIRSDHQAKTHLITMPETGSKVRPIEYLHELGHAILCEQVHPQFSTPYFTGAATEVLEQIRPASQAASDWFIDAWLLEICPDEERKEIAEHCNLVVKVLRSESSGTPDIMYGSALFIAQAIKYCSWQVAVGGKLEQAVASFLSVEPVPPAVGKLEELLNKLLAVLYPYQVRLRNDEWQVCNEQ